MTFPSAELLKYPYRFSRGLAKGHHSKHPNLLLQSKHKAWQLGLPAHASVDVPDVVPTFIAIGGGKGGVGKSILSANISAKLGQMGFKVLVIDLDLGGANLHTHYGVSMPPHSLADYVMSSQMSFESLLLKTCVEGVYLVAGGKDEAWSDTLDFTSGVFSQLWHALLHAKIQHHFEFVILDLGAGIHRHTIDFFTAAHLGMITVLPEPTSIENAYTFLKATLWRLIDNVGLALNLCAGSDELRQQLFYKAHPAPLSYVQKLNALESKFPELVQGVHLALKGRLLGFLVNQIRSQRDVEIATSMQTISRSYFGFDALSLGCLNYDEAAWKALRNRKLLLHDFPHSIFVKKLSEATVKLLQNLGY